MSKGRILVVEDNIDNYELVRFILERAGYDVFLAVNGRDGVAAARFQRPDMILMDVDMPKLDGVTATRLIMGCLPDVKVLMLSVHDEDARIVAAVQAGASGHDAAVAARDAAATGAASTIPMLATKGRASYLGERSVGHQDPGATSATLLLTVLAETAAAGSSDAAAATA